MKNYTKLKSKFIEEIQSNVTIYSHNKTGARICTMENDDDNKVFSIAFRTPPINNGGLTHILEHSVLCGSSKYPVKDPFVELLKSSLNTFLNAFTFPDKTMYPCASLNDKDFKNLMSVYMDAVFYPLIYKHEEIFMQEGWHYHITNEDEPITYNGVVYNEMKGAFSDAQQVLLRNIMHSLFPDSPYGYESGGDPKYIPDLSYEEFKEFHFKFYHPSNSYIFLYGDCDMEERMQWLDSEYLSKFERNDFNTKIPYQTPFHSPIYSSDYYRIGSDEDINNKTFLSYNVALPTTLDTKLMIALDILVTALFNTPGAPLKQVLIDAKLGEDVDSMLDDSLLQPILSLLVINSNPEKEEEFINLINSELGRMAKEGLDKTILESLLNFAEFKARERAFSARTPQGLNIQMTCLSSWLYSEDEPFTKLEILKYFSELKEDLKTNYFEELITKYILNNNHKTYVKLVPKQSDINEEEEFVLNKLLKYKESLTKEELKELIDKNIILEEYQQSPSTKDAIDSLPKLALEDINPSPEVYNLEVIKDRYELMFSDYFTNDIAYVKYYFDISSINKEDLLFVNLYSDLFRQLSTSKNTYQEINQMVQNYTGGMSLAIANMQTIDNEVKLYIVISFSALTDKVKIANNLIDEIINESNFNDEKRIYERLCELKASLEMNVAHRGHQVSLTRAMSYIDESYRNRDYLSGIAYIDFISNICKNYNSYKDTIKEKLNSIKQNLLAKKSFKVGFTGNKEQLELVRPIIDNFYDSLVENANYKTEEFVPNVLNEGFKTQYNVNYVARCGKYTMPYHGGLNVLSNCLSMDYLWNKVRVHGGAYGCMMNIDLNGNVGFTSYRDPNIDKTDKVYLEVADYVDNLNLTEEELLKYKIGAIGAAQVVLHVSDKAEVARNHYLRKLDYETRKKNRLGVINVTKEELQGFSKIFKEALAPDVICVVGNANKIDNSKLGFKEIKNLIK